MKKKLLTLFTLLIGVCSGAWATTELVYYNTSAFTISGTTLTAPSGLTITQSNSKNLASAQNISVAGNNRTGIKLSTGSRTLTFTAPSGSEITAITSYSYVNNTTADNGSWAISTGTEISKTAGTTFIAGSGNTSTPDIQTFVFEPSSSVVMTWTGKQLCAVFEVEYFSTTATKYTLTPASSPVAGSASISATRDYYAGSTFYLETTPSTGYAFTNWTNESSVEVSDATSFFGEMPSGNTTYTANFYLATTYTITGEITSGQESYGSISNGGNNIVVKDETISFTATPNEGYSFLKWQKDGADYSTDASITVTATADATYTAIFRKLYTVTFNLGTYAGTTTKVLNNFSEGNGYNEKYADAEDKYTIPSYAHRYLYNAGNVLTGWTDGINNYTTGQEITLTSDITLTPTWTPTTQTLAKSASEVTVTWNFRFSEILFNSWQYSPNIGYYTNPETINGELIAIPMIIDATSGKIDNSKRSANDNAQVNSGTKFTIPAVSGMTIAIADANTNFSTTTIAGSTEYTGSGSKSISYTYTGSDETIDIVINESNQYLKTIEVTYPKTHTFVDVTSAGYRTFASSSALDFTSGVAGLTAYKATVSGDDVTFSEITTAVPAKTGMLLKGDEGRYYIPLASGDPAAIDNAFVGVTASTEVTEPIFILYKDETHPIGFYKTTAPSFTVNANTAYLPASVSAHSFIGFEEGETTGINNVNVNHNDDWYDLQGRRVAQPTKGLYIVNGKKVIVK